MTAEATFALKNINLDVYEGEILGIVGESGCGKTTLISHMNSIMKPSSGEIEIYPEDGTTLYAHARRMSRG